MSKPSKKGGLAYLQSLEGKQLDVGKDGGKAPFKDTAEPKAAPAASSKAAPADAGKAGPPAAVAPKPGQKPPKQPRVGYMDLFKYSPSKDKWQIRAGILFSLLAGCVMPCYAIIIGQIVKMFDPTLSGDERRDMMIDFIYAVVIICVAAYVTAYLGYAFMQISAEKLSFKLRAKYLQALMKQEVAYFEKQQIEALPSKMAEYFTHISAGSGEKMGQLLQTCSSTIAGLTIGIVINPFYGLAITPYLFFASIVMV